MDFDPTDSMMQVSIEPAIRNEFHKFIQRWHASLGPELTTWNNAGQLYTNLELQNLYRAFCHGADCKK